jgi:hypothetical protein
LAYVPGYKYDIFISYARWDDEPFPGQERWVSTFVSAIKGLLHHMFGRGVDSLTIFLDVESFEANHQVEDLLAAVRQSAIFLAICSPNYEGREWTRAELDAFHAHAQDPGRLFAAEKLPLDTGLSYPAPLARQNRIKLWSASEMHGEGTARSLSHTDADFTRRVSGLVADIKKKLKSMHNDGGSDAVAPVATTRTPGNWRPVLLAQTTTDELDDQRDALRNYLEERGVPVLPRSPHRDYPFGGDAFKAAFGADLDQAALFVQLLGAFQGKAPPDLPQGFARYQAEAATAKNMTVLQWRRPDLQLDAVSNADYRRMLDGATVVAEDFANFKTRVLRHSEAPRPPPVEVSGGQNGGRRFVFVNAHKNDSRIAIRMAKALSAEKLESRTPLWTGNSAELRSSLTRDIRKCDALVVIYGNVDPGWVREQCVKYTEIKRDPARIVAVVMAPPEGKEEEDIGVFIPELEAIQLHDDQDQAVLQRVIAKLGA